MISRLQKVFKIHIILTITKSYYMEGGISLSDSAELIRRRILKLSNAKNITIHAIAVQGGLKPTTLQAFMEGRSKNPSIKLIEGVSDGLGISVKNFFDFDPFNLTHSERQNNKNNVETLEELLSAYNITGGELIEELKKAVKDRNK